MDRLAILAFGMMFLVACLFFLIGMAYAQSRVDRSCSSSNGFAGLHKSYYHCTMLEPRR